MLNVPLPVMGGVMSDINDPEYFRRTIISFE